MKTIMPRALQLTFLAALYAMTIAAGRAQPLTAKEVYRQAIPSVVVIVALDQNHQPLTLGSGFFIEPRLIVTNFHVVSRAANVQVFEATTRKEISVEGIHAIEPDRDLVILQTTQVSPALTPSETPLETGDPVFAIGNPKGLEGTLSAGIVSAVRQLEGTQLYQITAPVSPGSSGGPVLNERGQAVGIATSYIQDGQNLNFAVAMAHLKRLLQASRDRPLQPVSSLLKAQTSGPLQHRAALESVRVTGAKASGEFDAGVPAAAPAPMIERDCERECQDYERDLRRCQLRVGASCELQEQRWEVCQKSARIACEQGELKRQVEEQKRRQEQAARQAAAEQEAARYAIRWELSIRNEGDRPIKNPKLLILIFDQNSELIHYVQKEVTVSVPARLARRTTIIERNLPFSTYDAFKWKYQYRVLGFDYDE